MVKPAVVKTKELKLEIDYKNALSPLKSRMKQIPQKKLAQMWDDRISPFLQNLILDAVSNLKSAIEDTSYPEINKTEPFIETSYPVQTKWKDIERDINNSLSQLSKEKPQIKHKIDFSKNEEKILNTINEGRISIIKNDLEFELPKDILLLKDKDIPFSKINFHGEFHSQQHISFEGSIFVIITPLLVVKSTNTIRFPIFVGLTTKDNTHEKFNKSQEREFWKKLLELLTERTDKKNQSKKTLSFFGPTPIKSPMHLESSKHGSKPTLRDPKLPYDCKNNNVQIQVIGLDLDTKHRRALHAVQTLLAHTKYKGNVEGRTLDGRNDFKFSGYLPKIKFTRAEYLEAYGIKKYKTTRGKLEFGGRESKNALSALQDLATKNHLIISKRVRYEKGNEFIDRIQTVSPVIRIYEGWENLTKKEDEELTLGLKGETVKRKHSGFVVEPCPLLVDQIDSYFVLKPADMYQEIKLRVPGASKYAYAFTDLILQTATLQKGKNKKTWPTSIEFSIETLSYRLRLDGYIKNRKWKRIEQILNKCFQVAIDVGWIENYEEITGKTVEKIYRFHLNQKKFEGISKNQLKQIN